MKPSLVFRAGGALTPDDPYFSFEAYRSQDGRRLSLYGAPDYSPQVIASPKLTGKTTQVNYIANQHKRFGKGHIERVDINILPQSVRSEADLREKLVNELEARNAPTLKEIIETSRRLVQSGRRNVVAIINAEELPDTALRWLLAGIKGLEEDPTPMTQAVQVLVDGSFSIQTLTAGPDSDFPLTQVFPLEFTMEGQREFVVNGLGKLSIGLDEGAHQKLYDTTRGDKYLTQAICLRLALALGYPERYLIADQETVSRCAEDYAADSPQSDELRLTISRAVVELARTGRLEGINDLIRGIDKNWDEIATPVRALLYKSGIVRRSGQTGAILRAPLVLSVVEKALDRVRRVRELLERSVSLEGMMDHEEQREAGLAIGEIERSAAEGALTTLHAGYGRRIDNSSIEVEVFVLGAGQYSGVWDLAVNEEVRVGEEVWCLLWCEEPRRGRRRGEIMTFRIKEV